MTTRVGRALADLFAVAQEIFGQGVLWLMIAAAIVVTLGYLFVLIRDRSVSWKKFHYVQFSMPAGAILAVWFMLAMTGPLRPILPDPSMFRC
ncbi:DUF5368 domain-containing protein [Roseobacter sinensis]|uniref:DUF5368 domain-containing protein n=1 Tax=Roseobacter sinensis TaxID=2931391 RepID=UPI0021E7F2B5|nr:DUF5368 domain-containing protein [Roseobacter sp. WL0113]